MTDQEELQYLFDKSLAHIRKQGKPSIDDDGDCLYFGPNGCGCAARPFIVHPNSDFDYDGFEDADWESLAGHSFLLDMDLGLDPKAVRHSNFVLALQRAHDNVAKDPGSFLHLYERQMARVAADHDLKYEAPA